MTRRVVVVGATGAIGRPLCDRLIRSDHQAVVFTRDVKLARQVVTGADAYVSWSPQELSAEGSAQLGSADAVVCLAGAPLFGGRRHTVDDALRDLLAGPARLSETP